jgi:hypothetical protein
MSKRKTINRNAFNEKLIHRYFFERIYLNKEVRKDLVPSLLKTKISNLHLVVPEDDTLYSKYRADFTLYFKNDKKSYPVEIKWKSSELNKQNQIDELIKHNGYLVSFDKSTAKGLESIEIEPSDFQQWMTYRIDTLIEESLSTKVISKFGSKSWVVALRGDDAKLNFNKMKTFSKNKTKFWAFKNDLTAMSNILSLEKGDEMIFLFIKTSGREGSKMIGTSNNDMRLYEAYFTRIEDPYYMVLNGPQSTIFERNQVKPIQERIWPHFFDFIINEAFQFESPAILSRKIMSKELKQKIADSSNHGGVLMEINKVDLENLKGQIRTQRKTST